MNNYSASALIYLRRITLAASLLTLATALPARGAVWTNADPRDYDNNGNLVSALWSTEAEPVPGEVGNWSGGPYPGHNGVVDAYLGAPANTYLDVVASLNSLTIAPGGALYMGGSTTLTVTTTTIATDGTLFPGAPGGGTPFYNNAGTFRKSAGSGTYTLFPELIFNSLPGSVIQVDAGTLLLPGGSGLLDTVTFKVAAGAVVDLVGPGVGNTLVQGTLSGGTSLGTVRMSANFLVVNYFAAGKSCTLNFPGNVFQWTGGYIGSGGNVAYTPLFYNTGTMNLSGSGSKTSLSFFTNKKSIIQTGTGNLNIQDDILTNAAGATYDLRSDAGIITSSYGSFANAGLFKKSAGTGTSTITSYFDHLGGTVEVDSGTLLLPTNSNIHNTLSTGGNFVVAANALLDLGSGEIYTGTYTGSGAGTVRLSAGTVSLDPHNSTTPTIFNFPSSLFQWTGGQIGDASSELFKNQGTLTLSGNASKTFIANVTNAGTIIQTGTGSLNGYTNFTNAAGAVYDLRSDASILRGPNSDFPITNAGTLQKSGGIGTSTVDSRFTNTGTLLVESGTLAFTGPQFVQTAGVINLNGGNLSSVPDIQLNGGSIVGTGTITGNVVNNSGIVAPGHSPGKITVAGAYTQAAAGELDMQLGGKVAGTGYDQLKVTGAATLDGTLNITLINGFQPTLGDVFTFISAGSFNGTFSKVTTTGFTGQVDYSTNGVTLTITSAAPQLLNISTRLKVLTGANVLIGGFIITGEEPKKVIIRALGPSLGKAGVAGALADPVLELHKPNGSVTTNDNWKATQQAAIKATGVAPTNDKESAIVANLAPGNYTAVVRGKNNGTGVGLVEAYDLQASAGALANIATRGFVDTDNNVLIGGFIVGGGTAATNATVFVRAIGPSLSKAGIDNALKDPTLQLRDGNGNLLKSNDNWKSTQQKAIQATGIPPTDDKESALIDTLTPGNYTAIVRGKSNTTGVGLVEVYNLP